MSATHMHSKRVDCEGVGLGGELKIHDHLVRSLFAKSPFQILASALSRTHGSQHLLKLSLMTLSYSHGRLCVVVWGDRQVHNRRYVSQTEFITSHNIGQSQR